jgi:phage terminase large subunit GpA-like protein
MMTAMLEDISCLWEGFEAGITPPPQMSVAEWADEYLQLPSESAAEAGKFRLSRTPYLRKVLEALSPDSPYEKVVVRKGAQLGFTTAAVALIGYHIHIDPAPILFAQPDIGAVKKFSKKKLEPTIRETEVMRNRVAPPKSRDSSNTTLQKDFPGGSVSLTGAKSAQGLSGDTVRIAIADEVARYVSDVQGQGDPVEMIEARTSTYHNSMTFLLSTPEEEEDCLITREFEPTGQEMYFVPCPHCGHKQTLEWERVSWKKDVDPNSRKTLRHYPEDAHYVCELCGERIDEHHKTWMLDNGEWRATKPENYSPAVIGFHLSQLYAPLGWKKASWSAMAKSFIKAAHESARGNNDPLKAFTNLRLGEPWKEQGVKAAVTRDQLMLRRETYNAQVPMGACLLTCKVDVQDDRLEAEVSAWGPGEEHWDIEKVRLLGNPGYPQVWQELDKFRMRTWTHECGAQMHLAITGIDSGYRAQDVYNYVRPRQLDYRVVALKGASDKDPSRPVIGSLPNKTDLSKGVYIWLVGGAAAKDQVRARLALTEPGPGYMHFPRAYLDTSGREHLVPGYDDEHFGQLLSERKKKERNKKTGKHQYVWYLPSGLHNEALDLAVYDLSLLKIIYAVYHVNLDVRHRKLLARGTRAQAAVKTEGGQGPAPPAAPQKKIRPRRRGGFVSGMRY